MPSFIVIILVAFGIHVHAREPDDYNCEAKYREWMLKFTEYERDPESKNLEGVRKQPDFVDDMVLLPGGKHSTRADLEDQLLQWHQNCQLNQLSTDVRTDASKDLVPVVPARDLVPVVNEPTEGWDLVSGQMVKPTKRAKPRPEDPIPTMSGKVSSTPVASPHVVERAGWNPESRRWIMECERDGETWGIQGSWTGNMGGELRGKKGVKTNVGRQIDAERNSPGYIEAPHRTRITVGNDCVPGRVVDKLIDRALNVYTLSSRYTSHPILESTTMAKTHPDIGFVESAKRVGAMRLARTNTMMLPHNYEVNSTNFLTPAELERRRAGLKPTEAPPVLEQVPVQEVKAPPSFFSFKPKSEPAL